MKSAAYYVRKGLRSSIRYFLKHPQRIFLVLVLEIAKIISLPLFFLIPAFSKMQFNYTKMIFETGDASVSKSFDDVDKKPAFLYRLLFSTIFLVISISICAGVFGVFYLILFLVNNIIFGSFDTGIDLTPFNSGMLIFAGILSGVIIIYMYINFWVGNFISCASNELSLGDVFYNTLLTMKKNVGKIMLSFLLYLVMIFSVVFIFGFPVIILYAVLGASNLFNIILSIIVFIFALFFIFSFPILKTAFNLSMYEICDVCAELDQRVVVVNRKDLRGNNIKVNVLPYVEKSKRLEVNLEDLPLLKKEKKKGQEDDSNSIDN